VFFANDTSKTVWVKYKANKGKFTASLDHPTVFYGSAANKEGQIAYQIGADTIYKKLVANNVLNTLTLSQNSLKSVKVDFIKADSIPIYGFNFDDGKGVHVDNFSQRGNSGIPISKFDVKTMKAFQEKLNYDLIILHYGTNVLNYGTKDYTWYDKSMTRTINRLKACFPGVAILVISTADKATKYDLEMKTDSAVVPLTNAQKQYAIKTKSGFVNLFALMGGDGSITKWTEEEPALANKDYTHFNFRGAKKVAALLYDQLNKGYQEFKILRKNKTQSEENVIVPSDSIVPKTGSSDE
jgi:lysophospholipase L1-like esterase